MSRDKHIEEMAKIIHGWCNAPCPNDGCSNCMIYYKATKIYNAGYRKATEVIDEVVELLEELKDYYRIDEDIRAACGVRYAMIKVNELKKKYESENRQ